MINQQPQLPRHLAIIMDGNGRWAERQGKHRVWGHIKGTRIARQTIEECSRMGLEHLTLYAFSTENWLRPKDEVSFLMKLLAKYLRKERQTLIDNNIQFSCIGQIDRLPAFAQEELRKTIQVTRGNTGMKLFFALSYGGRQEIIAAAKLFAQKVQSGLARPEDLDESLFQTLISTYPTPDPDLIIRTSGEMRLSNFLTWQSVYSEIYITNTLWPDFTADDLRKAINHFIQRERRFGKTSSQVIESTL
jgi:undecaprenyl diphosphate synthase